MTTQEYKLTDEFESFDIGTQFTKVASYGESHVHAAKLQVDDGEFTTKHISVTEEQLDELFEKL